MVPLTAGPENAVNLTLKRRSIYGCARFGVIADCIWGQQAVDQDGAMMVGGLAASFCDGS
tara:strand:+ start:499 stop:678 length:180 start_codon:yes stop_codon:yes gene_type:complete